MKKTDDLNDLWKYDISSNSWTWIHDSDTANQTGEQKMKKKEKQKFHFFCSHSFFSGVYGSQGTGTTNTTPGARLGASSWIDLNGTLWLFGGAGYDNSSSFVGEFF